MHAEESVDRSQGRIYSDNPYQNDINGERAKIAVVDARCPLKMEASIKTIVIFQNFHGFFENFKDFENFSKFFQNISGYLSKLLLDLETACDAVYFYLTPPQRFFLEENYDYIMIAGNTFHCCFMISIIIFLTFTT